MGQIEMCVDHAQWRKNVFRQKRIERLAAHDFDERAEYVGVVAVDKLGAGLRVKRQ